ncbi:hypothetical protein AWJ11_04490 [Piscirickettsia salmonis]|nr:hypothetical protein AWE47_04505 [Piscirickettsia salmonis]AMA41716.1 hypothetical protein AWJ11_04490 [Piscirickettsia salmonis]APS71478.1 hypothetical protein AVI56_15025 [Piscirickettsia salmonis]KLV36951.1 hypothetical protein AB894_00195 [Piscirickettsia salmonis]
MYLALKNGHHRAIAAYIDGLVKANLSGSDLSQLFIAKAADDSSGLWVAAKNGHCQAVVVYIQEVLRAGLKNSDLMQILVPKDKNHTPILNFLMEHGRVDEVNAYIDGILSCQLPNYSKLEILGAVNGQGSSGLALAMKKGKFEVVDAFFEGIMSSNLSDESKKDLLIGDFDQDHLLNSALSQGHYQAVTAYINGILKLNLGKRERRVVLFAFSNQRRPGLRDAMEKGHYQVVKAYIEGISQDPELMHELLEQGVLGLALGKGRHQAIVSYTQTVLALGFNLADIKRLFSAKVGFVVALREGHVQAIAVYIKAVCQSGLDQNDIKELLTTIGFAAALVRGRVDAMETYIKGILDSDLSTEDKKNILMTPGPDGGGLYLALKKADYRTVLAYIQCILLSELPEKNQHELIVCGLQYALAVGDCKAIKCYVGAVIQAKLDINTFLLARAEDGTTGLYSALSNGHGEAVTAYCNSLLVLGPSERVSQLLVADGPGGELGLVAALKEDHVQAIKAYFSSVSQFDITSKVKYRLLLAQTTVGIPGLHVAVMARRYAAIDSYLNEVIKLSKEMQKELLAAKNPEGDSVLLLAFKQGDQRSVSICIKRVLQSRLDSHEKLAIFNGFLESALKAGHIQAVKIYSNSIIHSNLPIVEKADLLLGSLVCAANTCGYGALRGYIDELNRASHLIDLSAGSESQKNMIMETLILEGIVQAQKNTKDDTKVKNLQSVLDGMTQDNLTETLKRIAGIASKHRNLFTFGAKTAAWKGAEPYLELARNIAAIANDEWQQACSQRGSEAANQQSSLFFGRSRAHANNVEVHAEVKEESLLQVIHDQK